MMREDMESILLTEEELRCRIRGLCAAIDRYMDTN